MPKYKISDISMLYSMMAETDFGKICKAFLSCSRKNRGKGRFLWRVVFNAVQPKSNFFIFPRAMSQVNMVGFVPCLQRGL